MFNVLLTNNLKKRILNKFEMTLVKLIIIVFLSLKSPHIWIDVRVCVCPSAQPRWGGSGGNEGPGGTDAGQVGTPEAGLSGFEAGRYVLPRRARWASIERFVACPGALFSGRHRNSHAL